MKELYLNLITRNSLKGLGDENNLVIMEYLYKYGKTNYYMLKFAFKNIKIDPCLNDLVRYGLTYMSWSENSFNKEYLHYEISKLGKLFLEHLSKFLEE